MPSRNECPLLAATRVGIRLGSMSGWPSSENHMTADAPARTSLRKPGRIIEGHPIGHQGGGGQNSSSWASTMARLIPEVSPKSSPLMIKRRTPRQSSSHALPLGHDWSSFHMLWFHVLWFHRLMFDRFFLASRILVSGAVCADAPQSLSDPTLRLTAKQVRGAVSSAG